VQGNTANEIQQTIDARIRGPYKSAMVSTFQAYLRTSGKGMIQRAGAHLGLLGDEFNEFAETVGKLVRSEDPLPSNEFGQAAAHVRKTMAKALAEGKKAGIFDESIPSNPNYLPRIMNEFHVQKVLADADLGAKGLRKLTAKAILASAVKMGREGITPKIAEVMARAYVKTISHAAYGLNDAIVHGLDLDDITVLREFLTEGGIESDLIETVLAGVQKRNTEAGVIGSAKRRMELDENTSIEQNGKTLRFTDILENNVDVLMDKYMRRVSGAAALNTTLGRSVVGGFTGTASQIRKLSGEVRARSIDQGMSPAAVDKAAKTTEVLTRRIAGLPIEDLTGGLSMHPLSAGRRLTDAMRKFNFSTYMTQSGFASVAEFGNVLSVGGLSLLWHGLSNFRAFRRNALTGKLNDDVLEFFEEYIGIGGDNLLHPLFSRFDDFTHEVADPRALTGVERALNATQKLTAEVISQLGPMTRFQRRLIMMGVMKQIEGFALRGKALSPGQMKRVKLMGLTDAKLAKIAKGMQDHQITMQSGYRNRTFTRTNLDEWMKNDPETVNSFLLALQREAHNNIIEGTLADAPLWVNNLVGRTAAQFMTFAINAHTKLLLRNVELHDAQAAQAFLYSIMMASMAYTVQAYLNTMGDPEARKKALDPVTVAKRAVARAGHVALLPGVVDALSRMATGDAVFNARSTGLPSGTLKCIPTVATLDNAMNVLTIPRNARSDFQLSKSQARSAAGLIPVVGRMIGVRAYINALTDDLPTATRLQDDF